ncbi:MAG: CRISPR-associated ring nuclease Csm6 [Ignavibacteriaceae bacterium]
MANQNILICVTGLTPQIVTETFYCLTVQKRIKIDEIYIITTKRGRDVVLGNDTAANTPKSLLKNELINLCKKYKIKPPAFDNNDKHIITAKEESLELSDIRTDKHNVLFPNKVCKFISRLSSDPSSTLYCSISGGRKTMGVHLAFALSLFGRGNDKLLHVLTSEENEFKGFYPINKNEDKALEISEIPFVRLRSFIENEKTDDQILTHNYKEIVDYAQTQLKIHGSKTKMILDIERREISFNYNKKSLQPLLFLFYFHFVEAKLKNIGSYQVADFIDDQTKHDFIEYFQVYYPNHYVKEKKWYNKGFSKEDFRSMRSNVNKAIYGLINDKDIAEQFIIDVNRVYGSSIYYIKAEKEKFVIR